MQQKRRTAHRIESLEARRLLALVAAYSMNEAAGPAIADASGSGNSGSINGATWTSAGKYGAALSFNGSSSMVTINDANSLDLTTAMTLEAWVRPTSASSGWSTAILKERPGGLAYGLYASDGANKPPAGYINKGGADSSIAGRTALPLNTWSYLTATYGGGTLKIYVNGTQVGTKNVSGNIVTSSGALRIGGNSVWGEYFAGQIDEVRIYNVVRTAAQITTDMNTSIAPAVDATVPTVAITAPAAGAVVAKTVTLTATASDNVAVAGVQFLLDGSPIGPEDTTAPYSLQWDLSALSGSHTISAVARDTSNNTASAAARTITVDNLAPSVSITNPIGGVTVSGSIAVSASATDNLAIAGVQFFRDGISLGAEDTAAPYSVTWNTTGLSGAHTISAVARDSAGNITTSALTTITIDNADHTPPTVSLTAPGANAAVSGTTSVSAAASDNVGIAGVQFQLNGANLGAEDTTAPYSINWNTTQTANGNYSLTAVARDAGGNLTTSAAVPVRVANGVVGLTLVPAQQYQTIDGIGVNLNSAAWNNGDVLPALDAITSTMGASLYRVIVESVSGWEDTNDNSNPLIADQAYYNTLYSTTKFTNLWNTIKYLNDRNLPFDLNVMGTIPAWMSDANQGIPAAMEDEFVEMVTSMVDYGVHQKGLQINLFSPMNEQDWGHNEGPVVGVTQYVQIINKVINRLTALGLGSIQILGGDTAFNSTAYADALVADPTASQHMSHVAFHNYDGSSGGFADNPKYMTSSLNYWVTEFAGNQAVNGDSGVEVPDEWAFDKTSVQYLLNYIDAGAAGTTVYDGIDSDYQHHGGVNSQGMVRWESATNTYTIRKRLYAHAQVAKFVRPGMKFIGSTDTSTSLTQLSFYNAASGELAIVGQNTGATPMTIDMNLGGLPVTALALYETNATLNLQRLADISVANGIATVTIPADTLFTLVAPTSPDTTPPSAPANPSATNGYGKVTIRWEGSTDDRGIAGYDIYRSTDPDFIPALGNRIGQVSSTSLSYIDSAPAGTYYYAVVARDAAGNSSTPSATVQGISLSDTSPPTISITLPSSSATVSGSTTLTASAMDDIGVEGVFFYVDGNQIGAQDVSAPYSIVWNTAGVSNGTHLLTAVARDVAGNSTTSATVSVSVQNVALPAGLVAAWGFDDGAGNSALDSTGGGNVGIITGASWVSSGKYGSALSFNGTSNWVTVADSNSLDLTTGMTLEAWLKPTSLSGYSTALIKELGSGATGGLAYALYASDGTTRPAAGYIKRSGLDYAAVGASALPLNTWTHVATTYDGASIRLYINGALVSTRAIAGSITTSSSPLRIGGNSIWGEYFSGVIDEVRVYRTALSASQIVSDMNTAISPPAVATALFSSSAIGDAPPPGSINPPTRTPIRLSSASKTAQRIDLTSSNSPLG